MALQIQECIAELASQFNLDPTALQLFTDGIIRRINHYGIEKFKNASRKDQIELINSAAQHYILSMKKMHNDYMNNVNGARDKLHEEVYNEIKNGQK